MTLNRRLIPPLGCTETIASFCSRVAARCGRDFRSFCLDVGLDAGRLVEGCLEEARRLALLAGESFDDLFKGTTRADSVGRVVVGRHVLEASHIAKAQLRVCACCIADDIELGSGPIEARPWVRAEWTIRALQICPKHCVRLETLTASDKDPSDFPAQIRRYTGHLYLDRLDMKAPSDLERNIAQRFQGCDQGVFADWPLHALISASEMLGAAIVYGRKIDIEAIAEDRWWQVRQLGYQCLRGGQPAVSDLIDRLVAEFSKGVEAWTDRNVLGHELHHWLIEEADDPIFDELKENICRRLIEVAPFGLGDFLLGMPVRGRLVHSVVTAAVSAGIDPDFVRQVLAEHSAISASRWHRNHRILLPAELAHQTLKPFAHPDSYVARLKKPKAPSGPMAVW